MDIEVIQGFLCHGDPAAQTRALQYFEQLKSAEDGWQLCTKTLATGQHENHVKFFCLQVIEHFIKTRYEQSDATQQQQIREFICYWIRTQPESHKGEETFIKNKVAQLVSMVFLIDYPHHWPSFFADLLQTLSFGPSATDYYLRILLAINSDVADREIARTQKDLERNTLIKDTIREHCVNDLVNSWYHIVTSYQNSHPELSCLCLEVIGGYVAWIDIGLIANDRFVGILVHFLGHQDLREAACDCIHEIINKGMDPAAKTKLVESFMAVLDQAGVLNTAEDDDSDFMVKLAKLVNVMGTSVLTSWTKVLKLGDMQTTEVIKKAIENKIPLMLKFLNHEDEDVSQSVCEFAREYLQYLKHEIKLSSYDDMEKANVEAMIYIIINRYKYDETYNFAHQGEDEALFDEYRKSLKVLFDNIAQLDKEMVLTNVREMIVKTLQQWRTAPFQDVEVAITFLYLLGEAIPASQVNHFAGESDRQASMTEMLRLLVTSGVSRYGHIAVTLQFFETIVRYEKFFIQEPQHIPDVLIAFVDERGLRHSSPRIRSRTSYLFSRFIKCLKSHVQNFTEEILKQLQELLILASPENGLSTSLLSQDDQLFLYETSAILIVSSQFDLQKKQLLVKSILSPVIGKFEIFLQKLSVETEKEMQRVIADCMSHAIAVTSRTSKAFSNQQTMKSCGCVQIYLDALQVFLRCLELPYEQAVLQSAVRQYLHRMVVCLEEEILPFIPGAAEKLLRSTDIRSIQEFIPLINQIISKFKLSWVFQKEIVPYLLRIFMPLVSAIFAVLAVPIDENDQQAQRERQLLQRSYFLFIAAVVTNNVTEVIASQDMQNLEQVLLTIIQGAVDFPDPVAQKTCFSILKKMVELWGGSDGIPGFVDFIYKSIVPACFVAPLKDTFDLTDAQTILALSESATCLKTILDKRGDEFVNYLQSRYLPTLRVSPQQIHEYCQALKSDTKVFKNYLKVLSVRRRA
ncbi:exportin-T-like isoform X2 [Centruroides vittatus]|uniref:exportin-T-like isoform X2 n=1 Tax=Centruroides vittatus TaxID=120091 RepID=UPI00350F448D